MQCLVRDILVYFLVLIKFTIDSQAIDVATKTPAKVEDILQKTNLTNVKYLLNGSRRILQGNEAKSERPYMVYLKLPANNPKFQDYRRWLCGGVIIHEEYILTSAACIEDAKHFYVVSGTHRHDEQDDRFNNMCIKNGAKKAVWKCIPRNYAFDGHENDNIRWLSNDIAVVRVEDEFDFIRKIRGCDFVPRPICYNNQSRALEEPGNDASIAGWGSTSNYNSDGPSTQSLLETSVKIISKNKCKRRWGKRYYNIIENYMICSKDIIRDMSEICQEKYVDCTDIMYSSESGEDSRKMLGQTELVHSAYHNATGRRSVKQYDTGGFCENDHGGPLVYGHGTNAVVIGIISACLVKEQTNKCYGPFLYTSVFRNKNLISCAIYKDLATDCDKLFRSSETHTETEMRWVDHPDGPAKSELVKMRRVQEKEATRMNSTSTNINQTDINTEVAATKAIPAADSITEVNNVGKMTKEDNLNVAQDIITFDDVMSSDRIEQHEGIIIRAFRGTSTSKSKVGNTTTTLSFNNTKH